MKDRLSLRLAFAVFFSFVSTLAAAKTLTDLDGVQKAAWQRTLVMRIAKSHLQLAADVDVKQAQLELNHSVNEYEHILGQLLESAPNDDMYQRTENLKIKWKAFRNVALSVPTDESVESVMEGSTDLVYEADVVMRQWQALLPPLSGNKIHFALQQSMLSERINLFYTASYYGVKDKWVAKELQHSVDAYEQGMKSLNNAGLGDRVDQSLLSRLNSNWEFAKVNLGQFEEGRLVPVLMSVTMESMYDQTNTLAAAYHVQERVALSRDTIGVNRGLASQIYED